MDKFLFFFEVVFFIHTVYASYLISQFPHCLVQIFVEIFVLSNLTKR